jgi:hypothetical protein
MIENCNLSKCFLFENLGGMQPVYDTHESVRYIVLNNKLEPEISQGKMIIPYVIDNSISSDVIEKSIIDILIFASKIMPSEIDDYSVLRQFMKDRTLLELKVL